MADGPALALQAGLVAALRADPGVAALVGTSVYDQPPDTARTPYVRLGNLDVYPVRMDCAQDTEIRFSIEGHSRPAAGRVEATRLAEAVVAALDDRQAAITVAGHVLAWVQFDTQTVTRNTDGKTYTAIMAFTALISTAP